MLFLLYGKLVASARNKNYFKGSMLISVISYMG